MYFLKRFFLITFKYLIILFIWFSMLFRHLLPSRIYMYVQHVCSFLYRVRNFKEIYFCFSHWETVAKKVWSVMDLRKIWESCKFPFSPAKNLNFSKVQFFSCAREHSCEQTRGEKIGRSIVRALYHSGAPEFPEDSGKIQAFYESIDPVNRASTIRALTRMHFVLWLFFF